MPDNKNPFAALYDENKTANSGNVQTPVAEVKPATPVTKKETVKKEGTIERDASVLYRLNRNFYKEIQMFAKLKGESVNTILELAILNYMSNKENIDDYNTAKTMAEKLKK